MARLSLRDLSGMLPTLRKRPSLSCRSLQERALADWVQYLTEKKGKEFVRANSSKLLKAWEGFLRECWF